MIDQATFDRAEDIAAALDEQGAFEDVILHYLDGKLDRETERVVHGLLHAQTMCRNRAAHIAEQIARSGGEA